MTETEQDNIIEISWQEFLIKCPLLEDCDKATVAVCKAVYAYAYATGRCDEQGEQYGNAVQGDSDVLH